MRVPILVVTEICSSDILRFSRSCFSLLPKEGKQVPRFRPTKSYSVKKQDHSGLGIGVSQSVAGESVEDLRLRTPSIEAGANPSDGPRFLLQSRLDIFSPKPRILVAT